MPIKTAVLQPGLLVSLKTSVRGGVTYTRNEIEREAATDTGSVRAKWETTKEILDPIEFERAAKARGLATSAISSVCCRSTFGYLCPQAREQELSDAITTARGIAEQHNAGAACTRLDVFVLVGRIAQDDVEAAKAIGAEVRELLEAMKDGIAQADPEAIREAANKARAIGGMLTDEAAGKVTKAIDEARRAAREIVRAVEKSGETAATVVARCSVEAIEKARFAFLDTDAQPSVAPLPVAGRGVDLEPAPARDAAGVQPPLMLEV